MAIIIPSDILLLGSNGMLGSSFSSALSQHFSTLSREILDISQPERLLTAIIKLSPKIIINCIADTQVDAAEITPSNAFAVNALLPSLLAQSARQIGALLVHFSSTGCYGDNINNPLSPHSDFSSLQPTTIHHKSKLKGEELIRESGCDHIILRLGWLYGGSYTHRKNFVWARIQEAQQKSIMASDPYQLGSPSHINDVVKQTLFLIKSGIKGSFNCVNTGAVSRYDYTAHIIKAAGLSTHLVPTRFSRQAPVAFNEAAVNEKLILLGLNIMPEWDISLTNYIQTLLAQKESLF